MMEEELKYVTTFKQNGAPACEKEASTVIYAQVNVGRGNTLTPESPLQKSAEAGLHPLQKSAEAGIHPLQKSAEAGLHPLLCALAAALGIVCLVLTAVLAALISGFAAVTSEQEGQIENLTAQIVLLRTDVTHLESRTEELTREKDRLNWTVGAILQYDLFLVKEHCPQKVCQPCLDGWRRFQSSCYLFEEPSYSYRWKTWEGSRDKCKEVQADLVVIESLEEQEFISNNTKVYNDDAHGYWIGLSSKTTNGWMWIDGSNLTVAYWNTQKPGYKISCALTLPKEKALASWSKAGCDMKNRWICETKALISFDKDY